jgi:hypothetical protein
MIVKQEELEEFLKSGLLWWINRQLHLFGWAIFIAKDKETEEIVGLYPQKTDFREFSEKIEQDGFAVLGEYIKKSTTSSLKA